MTTGAGTSGRDGGMNLQTAVTLLPTPTVRDGSRGAGWGEYAAAVARWERVLGRPASAPTIVSPRNGRPQLAPAFVEWMMGVSAGHVTEVPGLTRNEMLSLLGDGVVPQQGAYAYRFMLEHLAERLAGSSLEEAA